MSECTAIPVNKVQEAGGIAPERIEVLQQAFARFNTASMDLERSYRRLEGQLKQLRSEVAGKRGIAVADEVIQGVKGISPMSVEGLQGMAQEKEVLSCDPAMRGLIRTAETVAASDVSVLIEGESGTGKERMARFIHVRSPRAEYPFVAVNCAAIPEGLLESELFGYEKGAFTGAFSRKPGRFEQAQKGTILLDEVSEMSGSAQAKLLRVLQEREIDPLGCTKPLVLDIRVIATSNRPLREEVRAGRFREDLYYRLNVFPLRLPPLRMRLADIPLLVAHFILASATRHHRMPLSLSSEALSALMSRVWRGNVRELENVIERAVLLAGEGVIDSGHLLLDEDEAVSTPSSETTVRDSERELILKTLGRVDGNRTHAARILGISIRTLRNKLREYRGPVDRNAAAEMGMASNACGG
jgi:two-component system response regulator FlrC